MRIVLAVVLMLSACNTRVETPVVETATPVVKAPPAPSAPIRTDRSSYVLTNGARGPEATIVATLRAPADRAVYIVNCNGASSTALQRKIGETWEFAWVIAMNACLSPPIVVPPGGEHTARIYLHEHSGGVMYPQRARMIESGTYRVAWTGVLTAFDSNAQGFGPELPLEQRVSAPFTIEVPPLTQLTLPEAERLVRLLADAINDPARDTKELEPYILHGPEALRAALARRVKEFIFELRGEKGTSLVEAHREDRVRIHSPLLDYFGVDEEKAVLRWRLRGPDADGKEITEPIELRFGDGLIGLK